MDTLQLEQNTAISNSMTIRVTPEWVYVEDKAILPGDLLLTVLLWLT
jgi:hypothetical protein